MASSRETAQCLPKDENSDLIVHIDMDAFYASVEIRDNPELVGRPVVVGGSSSGRGVVCAASYEARKFGVHSAMPARQALKRLCPNAVFLKPRMAHYAAESKKIREIFHRFTSLVEPLSLDEAFLDVAGSERLFGDAVTIARAIKQSIRDDLQLPCSAGVAPNKFLAKVASDLEKPDGLTVVPVDGIEAFSRAVEYFSRLGSRAENGSAAPTAGYQHGWTTEATV